MSIITEVQAVIEEFNLLNHPFYQAWSRGELPLSVLQDYAVQYYHQVDSFPRFISRVHTHCSDIAVRKVLLTNLVDEEISGTDHPTLWRQFAKGLGLNEAQVLHQAALPQTQTMVDTFYDLAEDWQAGLCALYAYEYQVPAVSTSKMQGLSEHYGIDDANTIEFFTAHQAYDVGHAAEVANLIEDHVGLDKAVAATREAASVLWGFLDGMHTTCHAC